MNGRFDRIRTYQTLRSGSAEPPTGAIQDPDPSYGADKAAVNENLVA